MPFIFRNDDILTRNIVRVKATKNNNLFPNA